MGLGVSDRSWLYSCRICHQSVAAASGASLWTALIAAWICLVAPEALPDDGLAFGDQASIPEAAVLVGQQHEGAVRGRACGPARLDEQHEREQPHDLRFLGQQLGQEPSEADCLRA